MTFEIDPCKSVLNNIIYDDDNNINTMNNLCYEISNAYGKVYGTDTKKKLEYKCSKMISDKKKQMGKSDCNLRRPPPPPVFNQIPHYFPSLLMETNNKDIAYKKCLDMAKNSLYPNTTSQYCRLDADAIITKENYTSIQDNSKIIENDNKKSKIIENDNKKSKINENDNFSLSFYIGIIIIFISICYLVEFNSGSLR